MGLVVNYGVFGNINYLAFLSYLAHHQGIRARYNLRMSRESKQVEHERLGILFKH